jgi:hypothetical protein
MPRTPEEIETELRQRAAAEAVNEVHPGEPTLVGWLNVFLAEIVALRIEAEERAEANK